MVGKRAESEPNAGDDGYEARLALEGEQDQVDRLFTEVFGRVRERSEWEWRYQRSPGGPPYVIVVVQGDRVVGHRVSGMHHATLEGAPISIGVAADAMVHPDHRGRGLLQRMATFLHERGAYDFRVVFPTDEGADAVFRKNPERVGVMPQWVRWLTAAGVEASRPGTPPALARSVVAAQRAARPLRSVAGRWAVHSVDHAPAALDDLGSMSAAFGRAVRVRDAAYVRWRWLERFDGPRRLLVARDRRGDIGAWAVVMHDPLASSTTGVHVARVVDLLSSHPLAQMAVLDDAVSKSQSDGADLVLLDYQDLRWWASSTCRATGFLRRGTGVNVVIHPLRNSPNPPLLPGDWYLTYGDTDLC